MSKKKVTITYLCKICLGEYKSRKGALGCEKQGIASPEFKRDEVVELVGIPTKEKIIFLSGRAVQYRKIEGGLGKIIEDYYDDEEDGFNPHFLPDFYLVCFETPGGKEVAVIPRQNLRHAAVDGAI